MHDPRTCRENKAHTLEYDSLLNKDKSDLCITDLKQNNNQK